VVKEIELKQTFLVKNKKQTYFLIYTMLGCKEKLRREKVVRENLRREKEMRNRVDLMCWLV
jgi:hypothetical protein